MAFEGTTQLQKLVKARDGREYELPCVDLAGPACEARTND